MKNVTIKVYRPTGEFITIWSKALFRGFTKELNGGIGSCLIELGETVSYSGEDLSLNNEVRVFVSDKDTEDYTDGNILIYSGYISNYIPWIDSSGEGIYVNLLGYYTKLAQDILKNGTTTTFEYSTLTDVGEIFRNVIDRYIAETSNPKLSYTASSLQDTGTDVKYKFEMTTYREAIDRIKEMSPAGWFWYIDEIGLVYFKQKPSTPTHTFIYGKDFGSFRIERSLEKIKNSVLFWNGKADADKVYKLYSDDNSILQYGRRVIKVTDERAIDTGGDTDTADQIGNKFIAEHSNPDVKIIVDIFDNNENDNLGYDIESINPGDTCVFKGFDESLADLFEYNALITKVDYYLNKAVITIEPLETGLVSIQKQTTEDVDRLSNYGAPTSYSI